MFKEFEEIDMMAEILQEVESKARNYDAIFKIDSGQTKKIRFLGEGNTGLMFDRHGRYVEGNAKAGWTVPCPVSFDKYPSNKGKERYHKTNCPYCEYAKNESIGASTAWGMGAWLIYNLTDDMKQVFCYPTKSTKGPVPALARQYVDKKTIMDRQFKIVKGTEKDFPTTSLDKDDPDTVPFKPTRDMVEKGFVVNMSTKDIQKDILKMMSQAWCPALLSSGSEFYMPAYHQPQAKQKAENAIESLFAADVEELPNLADIRLPGEDDYSNDAELEDLSSLTD